MLFAFWRRHADAFPEPLASRVRSLVGEDEQVLASGTASLIKAWSPAVLWKDGDNATGCAASNGADRAPPGQPIVRRDGDSLTIAAGTFPQYGLYYARASNDDYVLVSSSVETLARLLPDASLSVRRLLSYLVWTATDPDLGSTVFMGIRRLRPCETLAAGPNGVRVWRDVPRVGRRYRRARVDDLAAQLRERLRLAVERAIGSSSRVGVLTSGGLDSSGVLALAADLVGRGNDGSVLPLAVRFAAPGDDRPYLDAICAALDLRPDCLTARDVGSWFRQSLCVDARPTAVCTMSFDLALSAACVRRKLDVVLTGGSGDAICGGPMVLAQLARRGHLIAAVASALRMRVPWPTTPLGRVRYWVFTPLMPRRLFQARRRGTYRSAWIPPRFQPLLDQSWSAEESSEDILPDTPDAWMERLCGASGMSDVADGASQQLAATGCAPVDIFLDPDLVRFVLELDPTVLSHGDEYRGLYRLAMKGLLPERVRHRQDKASYEPIMAQAALSADALEMLRDLGSLETLATRGLVDPDPVRPMFDAWLAAVRRGERTERDPADEQWNQVWQLLSVEAFLRDQGYGRNLA